VSKHVSLTSRPTEYSPAEWERLLGENTRLKRALLLAIPWIGEYREGLRGANPRARRANRESCDIAFEAATDCFPEPGVYFPETVGRLAPEEPKK
jgi:hypothetical protein